MGRRSPSLADPRFLAALALLVANDRFWKAEYGNFVTGKVSDLAGLIVLPVILATIVGGRRWRPVVGIVGVWFALMKTVPSITAATVVLADGVLPWSNSIVTDPTDLIALPALYLAANVILRPIEWPLPKSIRVLVFVGAALATAATSTPEDYVDDNGQPPRTEACRPSNANECFRFFEGATIEQSLDAGETWTVVWEIDASSIATRRQAVDRTEDVVPYDINVTDSDVVVSFSNWSGPVRLIDGRWTPSEASFREIPWDSIVGFGVVAVLSVMTVSGAIVRRRTGARKLLALQIIAVALVVVSLAATAGSAIASTNDLVPYSIFIVVPVLPLIIVSGLLLAGDGDPLRGFSNRGRWALSGLVVAAATLPIVPFVLWSAADAIAYGFAVFLAVLVVAGVSAASIGLSQDPGR